MFIVGKQVSASTIEVTEGQLISLVGRSCKWDENGEKRYLVNEAVRRVEKKMHISEAQDRYWTLQRDYLLALETVGYDDIPQENLHIAMKHILSKFNPLYLKARMRSITVWRKNENFDKKDFDALKEVASKLTNCKVKRCLLDWPQITCYPKLKKI